MKSLKSIIKKKALKFWSFYGLRKRLLSILNRLKQKLDIKTENPWEILEVALVEIEKKTFYFYFHSSLFLKT